MHVMQCNDCLQFNEKHALPIDFAPHSPTTVTCHRDRVVRRGAALLLYREAGIAQLLRQSILVDLFPESSTKRIQYGECAADHPSR